MASAGDSVELTPTNPESRSVPTRLLAVISAVGILIGVLGLVLPGLVGARDEFAKDRQDVVTRASDFAVTFNTYTVKDKAGYQRRVKPLMTPDYYKDYVKITDAMFEVIKDKNQSSGDAKVLSVGVETIDQDSAVAILAGSRAVRSATSKTPVESQFRWKINMRKLKDTWVVSVFDSVPTMEASVDDVTGKGGGAK